MQLIIYLSNTPYQLIVAIQISITRNRNKKNIFLIGDTIPDAINIIKRMKKCQGFEKSYVINYKNSSWKEAMFHFPMSIFTTSKMKKTFNEPLILHYIKEAEEIFFSNVAGFTTAFVAFSQSINTNLKLSMFEDGVSSYSRIYEKSFNICSNSNNLFQQAFRIFFKPILTKVDNFFLFSPELLVWNCNCTVKKIQSITDNIKEIRKLLNIVFDYNSLKDSYEEKVIFFEESYIEDGMFVPDLEIVEKVIKKYGKSNVFIKAHPRVRNDRFLIRGIKKNIDTAIPWEVIAINKDIDKKILITMTSTAVVNSYLLLGSNANLIFEYEKLKIENNERILFTIEVIEKLEAIHPEILKKL